MNEAGLLPLPLASSEALLAMAASGEELALRERVAEACAAWLSRSPSKDTRSDYEFDLRQFLMFAGVSADRPELLTRIRPQQVAAWRDHLLAQGLTNSSVRRKMTVLRSLFSYLQTYGYVGNNPAHADFVAAPAAPRDGKTVGLSPEDRRRLLEAPPVVLKQPKTGEETPLPIGIRDRALFGVLAFTGCRLGELVALKISSYKTSGGHRIIEIRGKGGKERRVPLHPEAFERLEAWLDAAGIRDDSSGPVFRPMKTARGQGIDGFAARPLTRRAVQLLIKEYVRQLKLDRNVSAHSLRVTALTTARESGRDIIDLQDFAGHSDPRTTLTYIRNRDRLSKSPAYTIRY